MRLLDGRLFIAGAPDFNLVICGGTALITTELEPTDGELLGAVAWSRTHDPSDGYLECIKMFFTEFGYEHLVDRI